MHRTLTATLLVVPLLMGGCGRERRISRDVPPGVSAMPAVQTSDLQPGPKTVDPSVGAYQENRFAVSQGQTFYEQYNCAGCHSTGGGGGMGPPLNDADWIYGSDPENVFTTIVEGRPNGMPSFRGKIDNGQLWQLVAYVRSMSGLTPSDTWTVRSDHMQEVRPDRNGAPPAARP
jgi:cytochrome c oxidase cbb3-type subunit III